MKKMIFLVLFLFATKINAFGLPLVDIYGKYGYENYKGGSVSNLSLGIRPLDLPIIGGLRLEETFAINHDASYFDSSTYNKTAIYYDLFRFIPIVNPYLGVSFLPGIDLGTHAGLTFKIPMVPFYFDAEFSMYYKDKSDVPVGGDRIARTVMFSVRYNFL